MYVNIVRRELSRHVNIASFERCDVSVDVLKSILTQ